MSYIFKVQIWNCWVLENSENYEIAIMKQFFQSWEVDRTFYNFSKPKTFSYSSTATGYCRMQRTMPYKLHSVILGPCTHWFTPQMGQAEARREAPSGFLVDGSSRTPFC